MTATTTAIGHTIATIGLLLAAGMTATGAVVTKRSLRGLQARAAAAYPTADDTDDTATSAEHVPALAD